MKLHALLLTVLLAGCASSNSDAPRATMDPDHENAHYAPGLGEPDSARQADRDRSDGQREGEAQALRR